jgi:Raf kinase inhibitor-like YbhB/YbcL family protein
MAFELTSPAFHDSETIPRQFTGDGADHSPPLHWGAPPEGTRSLALLCEDPDAPRGVWVHWVIYNLPPHEDSLGEGVDAAEVLPNGARQGKNDFGKVGYGGPAPPRGKPHRYLFRLYALDTALDLPPGVDRPQVLRAMKGHVISERQLMGHYGR